MVKHSLALLLLSVVLYCADGLSVLPAQTFSPSRISSRATAYIPKQVSFTQQQQQCGRSSSATKIYSAAIAADAGDTNIKYGPGKFNRNFVHMMCSETLNNSIISSNVYTPLIIMYKQLQLVN